MGLPANIETREDIVQFFRYLIFDEDLNFYPDTPFNGYSNRNGNPSYTPEECAERDRLLDQCFELAGDDVYDIGLPPMFEFLGWTNPNAPSSDFPTPYDIPERAPLHCQTLAACFLL